MTAKLDSSPLGTSVRIALIDWDVLSHDEGRRLREFGLLEGVEVKPLHRGSLFSREPLAQEKRSEEHTSELQSLMRISYAVFCLKKKKIYKITTKSTTNNNY